MMRVLLALVFVLMAARVEAGFGTLSCPMGGHAVGTTFDVPVEITVGGTPLGAYALTLTYNPLWFTITGIVGGTTPEFSAAPMTNPASFMTGTTIVAALQVSNDVGPIGTVHVATITFQVVGGDGAPNIGLTIQDLFDTADAPIAITSATGCAPC